MIPLLIYHAVNDVPVRGVERYTVSRARLAAHLDAICARRRTALCVSEIAACLRRERSLPPGTIGITFDDGYADTYAAVQELHDRGLSSTIYLTTSAIAAPGRLSESQILELSGVDGVELGSHGIHHARLDELHGPELVHEVAGSKRRLAELLGYEPRSFAYPHGAHDSRAREAVIRAGYTSAAAVKDAVSHLDDDPYAIARWTVNARTKASQIAAVLDGYGVRPAETRERVRTRAYRAARRLRRRASQRSS